MKRVSNDARNNKLIIITKRWARRTKQQSSNSSHQERIKRWKWISITRVKSWRPFGLNWRCISFLSWWERICTLFQLHCTHVRHRIALTPSELLHQSSLQWKPLPCYRQFHLIRGGDRAGPAVGALIVAFYDTQWHTSSCPQEEYL